MSSFYLPVPSRGAGCSPCEDCPGPYDLIFPDHLNVFHELLKRSGVKIDNTDEVTILAPSNTAFYRYIDERHPEFGGDLVGWMHTIDPGMARRIVRHHIIRGHLSLSELKYSTKMLLVNLASGNVPLRHKNGSIRVGEECDRINIVLPDVCLGNRGLAHVIDGVISTDHLLFT